MAEHPNVVVYRGVHERLQQGDFDAFYEALDDDVVWHPHPQSGTYPSG